MRYVFISSTTGALQETREAVRDAIHGIIDFEPVDMESFGARCTKPVETCLEEVARSQVFVGIIGEHYGSSPPAGDPSFTEREYDEAVRLRLDRLMLMTPDLPAGIADPRQAAFRARILSENTAKMVHRATPDRFALHVATALANLKTYTPAFDGTRNILHVAVAIVIAAAVVAMFDRLALGPATTERAVAAMECFGAAVALICLCFMHWHYGNVLASSALTPGSPGRSGYEGLRRRLHPGPGVGSRYAERLRYWLGRVDRFFGDADVTDSGWLGRTIGLRDRAPLLTVPLFERSVSIALTYPIMMLVVVWIVTGHAGPAERALSLTSETPLLSRIIAAIIYAGYTVLLYHLGNMELKLNKAALIFMFSSLFATLVLVKILHASFLPMLIIIAIFGSARDQNAGMVLISLMTINFVLTIIPTRSINIMQIESLNFTLNWGFWTDYTGLAMVIVTVAFSGILAVGIERNWRATYYVWMPATVIFCLSLAYYLGDYQNWEKNSPLVIFMVLLAAINAPFDWLALGTTRAMLRLGMQFGRGAPIALAILDSAIALVAVYILAFTMAVLLQAFEMLALWAGGTSALSVGDLLDGVRADPRAPEYWWLYVTLVSTLIPSILNLIIGCFTLLRGLPLISSLIHSHMPQDGIVATVDRGWIPLLLTLQLAWEP